MTAAALMVWAVLGNPLVLLAGRPPAEPPAAGMVEVTGAAVVHTDNADATIDYTVPADAEAVVVVLAGYNGQSGADLLTALNADGAGMDFATIVQGQYAAGLNVAAAYYLGDWQAGWPGTGACELTWARGGSGFSRGYAFVVFSVKGVDEGAPIVDSEWRTGGAAYTSALSGVATGDLAFAAGYRYNGTFDVDPAGYGQTAIHEAAGVFNLCGYGVAAELGEGELFLDTPSNLVPIAWAFRAAAAE